MISNHGMLCLFKERETHKGKEVVEDDLMEARFKALVSGYTFYVYTLPFLGS